MDPNKFSPEHVKEVKALMCIHFSKTHGGQARRDHDPSDAQWHDNALICIPLINQITIANMKKLQDEERARNA